MPNVQPYRQLLSPVCITCAPICQYAKLLDAFTADIKDGQNAAHYENPILRSIISAMASEIEKIEAEIKQPTLFSSVADLLADPERRLEVRPAYRTNIR